MNFGQKLQTARINMNLTQQKVADDFFITRQTISSWENDNSYPDVMTLIKLSDYFGFSIDKILREDKQMRLFLDKKAVKNDFKPIYRILLLTSFILLVIELEEN
ncbi:transcriptional regulator with XRE-family HTH domain [Weissella beninensis]|uniref:Helix-turn-helix transcriptional regulator n=1 Tax=Periweissella beninensis TaxID=504936 RepID=A0ABT0VH42_9LACO|nr:helix-turn-helix transcriptional regulator [Periweissella beninensis]MBM7545046.1 transcriptional regulator with XRE-family HTH domain [Periweissella beninensis]MCM2437158.1 helix-turn-helix transcriptional regulator [Periweissella beninensis]